MKWFLICLAVILVACTRLISEEYRFWNLTAFGGLALFIAARVGVWQSIGITAAALLVSDFVQFAEHHYDMMYLPFAPTYIGLAAYAIVGRWMIGSSRNAVVIGGSALQASVLFFLITNLASWFSPVHGYERSFKGLFDCYSAALPFFKGTVAGDLGFTALLFGAYELLCQPAAKTAPATNEI